MKLILLGAPGAGKGTQAEVLSKMFSIPIIGTGNIIREAIRSGSQLGVRFKSYTDKGLLVPDELVVEMVADRIGRADCNSGYILDGFPRTVFQAEAFEKMGGAIDCVLSFEISDENVMKRMTGRRVCSSCGNPYHAEYNPPKVDGVCSICGGKLEIRVDDAPETVAERLKVYHQQTQPLVDYYSNHGRFVVIDAMQSVDEITRAAASILETI